MDRSLLEIRLQYKSLKRHDRRLLGISLIILLAAFLLSLGFRTAAPGFIPVETVKDYGAFFKLFFASVFETNDVYDKADILANLPYYGETLKRGYTSCLTLVAGMALGMSGAVFQQVYHNPIASPSTIGATAGVNLGNLVMVMLYSYTAIEMILYRYIVCILLTLAIMVVIIIVGKVTGGRMQNYSVVEMLMFGSILSRMITSFNTYWMFNMSGNALIAYQQIVLGVYQIITVESMAMFLGIIGLGILILLRMRFRINAVGMDPMEMKASGINIGRERVVVQLIAAVIIAAACVQCGDVGLFALVIPHVVRYIYGSDFRKIAVYSTIYGGIFLLVIRMVSSLIFLGTEPIPMTFIVSVIMIPVFMIILVLNRRGFD